MLLKINGKEYLLNVDKSETLLYTLRERLDLTGTKKGCDTGNCGSCKVLINGEAKSSCHIFTWKLEGMEIETIENFAKEEKLHFIQEAFIEAGAVQCGYCTPGMIITTKGLLNKNKNPTDEDINIAFKGNLCRCTGYIKIIKAVKLSVEKMRGNV